MTRARRTFVTRAIEMIIKVSTLSVLIEGLRQRNTNAIVNSVLMLVATFLPSITKRLYNVQFQPWQQVYTETTMLAHAIGFLGPYDDTWWWDHVTHVLSATLLGGFIHVASHRRGRNPKRDVLTSIVGGGILWESMEYTIHQLSDQLGIEPVLVYYGPRDTLKDLLFNLLGALLVLVFGDRLLRNFTRDTDSSPEVT